MINSKIINTLLISFGFLSIYSSSAQAQSANISQPDAFQSNEVDPVYGNSGFNPMDLIHNANLFNGRNNADFLEDTNENLDSATSDFKKEQLKRLQEMQQQQSQPTTEDTENLIEPQ